MRTIKSLFSKKHSTPTQDPTEKLLASTDKMLAQYHANLNN